MAFIEKSKRGPIFVVGYGDERPTEWFSKKALALFDLMKRSARNNGEDPEDTILWSVALAYGEPSAYVIEGSYGGIIYDPDTAKLLKEKEWISWADEKDIWRWKEGHTMGPIERLTYNEAKNIARQYFD